MNQLVKARVLRYVISYLLSASSKVKLCLSVNTEKKQVELSFRSGDLKRDNQPQLTLSDLSEGQKVEGRVKKVEDYGIFIAIEGSKLSGLCHKSEVRQYSPYIEQN